MTAPRTGDSQPDSQQQLKEEAERTMTASSSFPRIQCAVATSVARLTALLYKKRIFKLGGFLLLVYKAWLNRPKSPPSE